MPRELAFLHTAEVHVQTFDALLAETAPAIRARHAVQPQLLAEAKAAGGIDAGLAQRIRDAMDAAAGENAGVVVCTCSTIGGVAEDMEGTRPYRAMRIDRAMADHAVRCGPDILVVAALDSTLAPTAALIRSSAQRIGRDVRLRHVLLADAWAHFERGDSAAYLAAVADAVRADAGPKDVVVLAQASMAAAAAQCAGMPVPVLASPRLGVEAAVRALRD
ncbi:Asp/Glu/hydantoin racemase [Oxalobacteraceae bacterium OM1]|nr:Asp/Glu/hydantoin racemase [Oxalobacteraceae bacterium OM1]